MGFKFNPFTGNLDNDGVPYIGANKNVDLGDKSLFATTLNLNGYDLQLDYETVKLSFTTPYYGRLNFAVPPAIGRNFTGNGRSEVRYVSKGAINGTGQTYFVIASSELNDTGNNLLMGVSSGRAFLTNAVNYSSAGEINIGGYSWSADGVLKVSGDTRINSGTAYMLGSFNINNRNSVSLPLRVRGATSQSANLTEWQNSLGNVLSVVDKDGNVGIGTTTPDTKLQVVGTSKFGEDITNYSEFESDGSYKANGTATIFVDLLGDVTKLKIKGTGISLNDTEQSIDFTTSANLSDYVWSNFQILHEWKIGSTIYPHIHWEQSQNNIPNFLMQYRWQRNGGTKTTVWTDYPLTQNAFTYVSGTLNQISFNGGIVPPVDAGLSDILEIRIYRDNSNSSGAFVGADAYTSTVGITSVDIHIECDTLGSRQQYIK